MPDIALASCLTLPEPDPDASPLLDALRQRGLDTVVAPWDGEFAWDRVKMVLLRSTWNYYLDRDRFLGWIDRVTAVTALHNPANVVRWNTDKHYLGDLAARAVPTVPTAHLPRGRDADVEGLCERRGWRRVVVKPAVSAASFETHVMEAGAIETDVVAALVADRDMMVQPFVESVADYGERSVVVVDGEPTHSVRKSPRFGGEDEDVSGPQPIADDERALALQAVRAAEAVLGVERLLYARVDMARDAAGAPMVMELELTEPSLFFAQGPEALERLADRVAALVASR